MENKEAIENLKAATKEFNIALRESVNGRNKELNGTVYKFDLERGKAELVSSVSVEDASDKDLEYFWIEYEEGEKKLAFFFKDIDTSTHNVHVVPGIFEEFDKRDKLEPRKPFVAVENGKPVLKNTVGRYSLFAEQNADGLWWVPTKSKIDLNNGIGELSTVFDCFKRSSIKAAEEYLKANSLTLRVGENRTQRYNPVNWKNYWLNDDKYTMYLTNVIYYEGYGFFTQYNCYRFAEDKIITDYPIRVTSIYDLYSEK